MLEQSILWIQNNYVEIVALVVLFEKAVNIIVGWTSTKADDNAWEKIKSTVLWFLNVRSNAASK